jgi:hypothetical protein
VRRAVVIFVAAAACGRIGFDRSPSGDAGSFDGADPPGDGGPTPPLLCGETFTNTAGALSGSGPLTAAVIGRHLVALWVDGGGALRGTTWTAATAGVMVAQDGVAIAPGPVAGPIWATTNGDTMLVAVTEASQVVLRFLHEDLSPALPKLSLAGSLSTGRHPIARERTGTGFVVISIAGDVPAIAVIHNGMNPTQALLLQGLRFHGVPSIAEDRSGYAVVTELADQFGPGCWLTRLTDSFAVTAGPGSLESTQQADCDSSIATASAGASGAGTAWMDRDPVNSYVEFRGTDGGGNTASMSGEVGAGQPLITATSTGFAVAYRSALGLRVFDRGGPRTLDPDPVVFDLVTWVDRAILVWTKLGDARPRLTRLCP